MQQFLRSGFSVDAIYRNIENPPLKKSWISRFSDKHDLCILKKPDCTDVELVQQGSVSESRSFIRKVVNMEKTTQVHINTDNVENSRLFWEKLGFQSNMHETLIFSPILSGQPLCLHLHHDPGFARQKTLDAWGIYSMAFLSHNAELEQKKLVRRGITVTDINTLSLGGSLLRIFFVVGAQNELIEIYDIISHNR